ncbi:MAG: NAD-dependent deacetylase [Euzebyales bacterium]|nr:NAD-dependent deacetylase [Euzebyales bacterium]MBA3621626.1 NAD-dependent deacetylase [Euzebyales bacterium]
MTELAALLTAARRVVAFTGAGVSTESGVPDFRSPGGVWTRYDPRDFTFGKYVSDPDVRRRAWAMRREFWANDPQPNAAHRALVDLEQAGRMLGVVTQNIDGLHQAAGSKRVVEIHGTSREVMCIGEAPRLGTPDGCGWAGPTRWAFEAIDSGVEVPSCPGCGGIVKSATISFGQNLVPEVIGAATSMVAASDLLVAIGSSLQVYPAAGLPELAAAKGIPVIIVNDEPTPLDYLAEAVIRGRAGDVLPPAVEAAI